MNRTERRKERTRQKIIGVAERLFAEHGVAETTMEQIAAETDIAKATLYKYFPVKEAIIGAYIEQTFAEKHPIRVEELQALPDTRARMIHLFGQLVAGVQAQQELFERYLIYQLQAIGALTPTARPPGGLGQLAQIIITWGQQSGEIRADVPLDMLQDLFEIMFVTVVKQFYQSPAAFNDDIIARGVDLFITGAGN